MHVTCVNIDLPDQIVYKSGQKATYRIYSQFYGLNTHELRSSADDHLWIARWWTQGDVPSGSGASYM